MKQLKIPLFLPLVLVAAVVLFLWKAHPSKSPPLISERTSPTVESSLRKGVLYMEVTETNRDNLNTELVDGLPSHQGWPFLLKEDRLVLNPKLQASIQKGKGRDEFGVVLDQPILDLKQAKLILSYRVLYEGKGREGEVVTHYVFSRWPAQVTLPVFEQSSVQWQMTLDDPMNRILEIRPLHQPQLTLTELSGETVGLLCGDQNRQLGIGEEISLAKGTQTLAISQEILAPVPKGHVSEQDIRAEKVDFGPVEFSAELRIKNYGKLSLYEK